MSQSMLKSSQIQDVWIILREVLTFKTAVPVGKCSFLYLYAGYFSALTSAFISCWGTWKSLLTDVQQLISFHIDEHPWASERMSDLHSQLWVFPLQTKDVVSASIEAPERDELFNLLRLCVTDSQVRVGRDTKISPWRSDRRGQLCSHCERKTHKIQEAYILNSHTYVYATLLLCLAVVSFIFSL